MDAQITSYYNVHNTCCLSVQFIRHDIEETLSLICIRKLIAESSLFEHRPSYSKLKMDHGLVG